MRVRALYIYAALLVIAGFLLFFNLDDRLLWGDEAETALLAANITRFGLPRTDDGKNDMTIGQRESWSNEDDLWIWSPWLDEYVVAASFSLFGQTSWAARFPCAVIGLLTVVFAGWLAYRATGNHETAAITVLLLVTCVPFLILSRQCRYYSLVMFAQVWIISAFGQMCATGGRRGVVQLILALVIQFYGNYIVVPPNLLAIGLAAVPFGLRDTRIFWALSAVFAAFGVAAAPWLIYARPAAQAGTLALENFMPTLAYYVGEMNFFILPVAVFFIPPVVSGVRAAGDWLGSAGGARGRSSGRAPKSAHRKTEQPPNHPGDRHRETESKLEGRGHSAATKNFPLAVAWLLWSSLLTHLLFLGVTPYPFFRYLCPLIPVAAILGAGIVTYYVPWRSLRYAFVATLALSNMVGIYTAYPWRGDQDVDLPIVRFAHSLVTPYTDRLEDVVSYLNERKQPNDIVLAPSAEMPLIFHTDMRVIDEHAGFAFFSPGEWPEWVFPVSPCHALDPAPRLEEVSDEWLQANYDTIRLTVHDSSRGANRPDPNHHEPFTSESSEEFIIYRKRSGVAVP